MMFKRLVSLFKKENKNITIETKTHTEEDTKEIYSLKIKGNINKKGEKIYHLPEGRFYNATKAKELFKTEDEAVKAGYRKSRA